MVPHTRRRFLHVAAAATGGLAGCGRLTSGSTSATRSATQTESVPPESNGAASNTATDPPMVLVRGGTDRPPIRLADPNSEDTETPHRERLATRIRYEVIGSQSRADRLTVADGVNDGDGETIGDDRDSVASFVGETDFESETLYLHTNRVEECFRLRLCRISWHSDSIDTDYTRQLRPYDERCDADEKVYESRLIRLPVALDEDAVTSYSSSVGGSGRCDPTDAARSDGADSASDAVSNSGSTSGSSSDSGGGSTTEVESSEGSETANGSANASQRTADGGGQ